MTRRDEAQMVAPEEVPRLLEEGYVFVDVRSEPEYQSGHVPGAYNVPIAHAVPTGLAPNPDFLAVMRACFAPSQRLVLGCKTGGRSAQAHGALKAAGFEQVRDMSLGWYGQRDAFGRLTPGWQRRGLPVETAALPGRDYASLRQR